MSVDLTGPPEPATAPAEPLSLAPHADDEDDVTFGRNRLLRYLGAGLFAFASQSVLRAKPAWGSHTGPPGPCYQYPSCHSCSGSTCTLSTCGYYWWLGCPTGGQCWQACYSNCVWNCCDWSWTAGSEWRTCICGTCISGRRC